MPSSSGYVHERAPMDVHSLAPSLGILNRTLNWPLSRCRFAGHSATAVTQHSVAR